MKKEFYKHLPKLKKESIQCQKNFQTPIIDTFQRIKTNFNLLDCVKLQNLLQTQKQVRPIEQNLKKQIFKFFLEKQLIDFSFLKSRSKVVIRILKSTKVKLEDLKYDWLEIWKRVLTQFPQISRKDNFQLQQFLKIIKIFFDENNPLDVFNYFIRKHGDHSEYVFTYILIFSNITVNTKEQIFQQFLEEMVQCYMKAQIKPKTLLIYFINLMKKRKTSEIPAERYKMMKDIIMSTILTPPSKDAKSSVESKFTKEYAIMISQFIGKHNPYSEETIKILFQVAEKFIFPFENSTKSVRFLYNLIRFIWKRMQKQRRARERLQKLIEREKKVEAEKEKKVKIQTNQQTAEQHPPSDQKVQVEEEDEMNEEDEEVESDDQKEKEQALDEELNNADEEILSNEIEERKNRCLKILKNQITPEIIEIIKDGIKRLFNYIYFVNSKKTVQQFIRYSFIILPELVINSLDLLDKASQIPYINEEGLVMNIQITVQYMFSKSELLKDSLNNLSRILDRIIGCKNINEVWSIYEFLVSKIPLLDEKDLEKVPDSDKELFEKKFEMNHDRFYEYYSSNVFRAFKRMIQEGEYFQESTAKENGTCFEELLLNSYPYFKKTLLDLVLEEITQNRKNQFVYTFFNSHLTINARTEEIIDEQMNLIKDNTSRQVMELKNNLVMLLCYTKPFSELKRYIREFAQKNSFRVISIYYGFKAEFNLTTDPVDSALKYFDENPKIKFRTTKTIENRLNAIEEISQYKDELLDELHKLVASPPSLTNITVNQSTDPNQQKSLEEIIQYACSLYKANNESQSSTKISLETVGIRKKIIELLRLINSISTLLRHRVIDYDNESMKFKSIFPITRKRSLIESKKFMQVVKALISDDSYLHDVQLTGVLSELITHELVFNYGNQVRECKSNIGRNSFWNAYQQLPDYISRYWAMDCHKEKIMLIHYANLLNEVKRDRADWLGQEKTADQEESNQELFDKLLNDMKILILAPGNQKSISLIKATLIIIGLKGVNQFLLCLYRQTDIESRFYWQKVNQIFEEFKSYGITFSVDELVQLIDNHGKIIMTKDNKKVKEILTQSFKHVISLIKEQQNNADKQSQPSNIEMLQKIMRKHVDHEKFRLFWILTVNFVLQSRKFTCFANDHIKAKMIKLEYIWDFMRLLQPMIMSETRIVRRLALFVYSLCIRKARKIIKVYEIKSVSTIEYKPKDIADFLQTGYLRENHIHEKDRIIHNEDGKVSYLKFTDSLVKISPYDEYEVATIDTTTELYQLYKKIEDQSFEFILKNEDESFKFITSFHADMVSTAEQLIAMANVPKSPELSDLIVKELEESFYFFVPKELSFDKVELYFGERFFKYLIGKDARNDFQFLFSEKVRELLDRSIMNLESLDNQALILITSQDLVHAYQREYDNLKPEIREKVEKYILEMYSELSKKSSGSIYKKWMYIFKKVESERALSFLLQSARKEIFESKKRVCRNAYVYLSIKSNDFEGHVNVVKVLLDNRIELQNSIVNKIINSILTHPEKFPIDKRLALNYQFIDFQKELLAHSIDKSTQRTYIINNSQFKDYLVEILRKYVRSNNENSAKFNQFIKNAYALILNAINCFCHSYESAQNSLKIAQLLDLIHEMSLNKEETQVVDYDQAQPYLKTIFAYQFEDVANFQTILSSVMKLVKVLPSKRQAELLTIILHRPYNFTMLSSQKYEDFLYEIFTLEQTSNHYKELMSNLSVIMSFRMPPIQKFIDMIASKCEVIGLEGKSQTQKAKLLVKNKKTKGKILLLYQCEQLALLKLHKQMTSFILNESPKERKNIWCRQMLALRGKKEYLDDEETYHVWQTIKSNSNPYNYIV